MSTVQLYVRAEAIVQAMELPPKEAGVVRSTIHNYACPSILIDKIYWVIYRIIDAIRGFFRETDWEKTKKLMQQHWKDTHIVKGEVSQLPKSSQNQISRFFTDASEELLKLAITAQEERLAETAEFRGYLNKLTISTQVGQIIAHTKG